MGRETLLMHVINSVGAEMDLPSARAILGNLVGAGALDPLVGETVLLCLEDKTLAAVPRQNRDTLRAEMLKQVLIHQMG
jgi:transcriptional regulator CtsR